jgi:hypothetical protein
MDGTLSCAQIKVFLAECSLHSVAIACSSLEASSGGRIKCRSPAHSVPRMAIWCGVHWLAAHTISAVCTYRCTQTYHNHSCESRGPTNRQCQPAYSRTTRCHSHRATRHRCRCLFVGRCYKVVVCNYRCIYTCHRAGTLATTLQSRMSHLQL